MVSVSPDVESRAEGRAGDQDTTPQLYGERLAKGEDMLGSAELALAQQALEGLIDPDTRKGQPGGWLLFPFHESLLWYDARRQGSKGRWGVRRVWMRGSGITIARMLASPPDAAGSAALGQSAVCALREVLQASSPLADIADQLEAPLAADDGSQRIEDAEREAWRLGGEQQAAPLAGQLCRDAEGILRQGGASGPAKLWQLRIMLGLDVALHALKTAWEATATPTRERFLLLSFAGPPRAENRVRQRSEAAFASARIRLREAILAQLATDIRRLEQEGVSTWQEEFITRRGQLRSQIRELDRGELSDNDVDRLAREIVDEADYGRPVGGFTNLIQTAGLLAGTGQYRYLTATPELFSALVGALSSRMPMPSDEFFDIVFEQWGLVIGQSAAARTVLAREIDGALLERNARRAEQELADSGLALALSDRTTLVGERADRRGI